MLEFDPVPKRNLLSFRVRGPELAAIYAELNASGSLNLEEIVERFAPPADPRNDELVREGLEMLRALELVWRTKSGEDSEPLYKVSEEISVDVPFQLLALERLHLMNDARQVFRLVHDFIVEKNIFFADRHKLLVDLEGDYPDTEYAWNVEKIRTWKAIAEYLGLVRDVKPSEGDILVSPIPRLLTQILRAYALETGAAGRQSLRLPLREWLDFTENRYFRCHTERSEVHQGLAGALLSMEERREIGLTMLSDADSASLKGKRASHVEFIPLSAY